MAQTKKLILSLILGFLMLINLAVLAYTAIPLARAFQGESTRLGLKLIPEPNATVSTAEIERALAVIASRLSAVGVSLAVVEQSHAEGEHLAVVIPAGHDVKRIKEVITYFGLLELIPLVKDTQIPYPTKEAAEKAAKDSGISTFVLLRYRERKSADEARDEWVIAEKNPLVTGTDFRVAQAIKSQYGGDNYEISFTLHPEGAARLADWTAKNVGATLAIVLNHEVKSAPRVMSQISDSGQISGSFTKLSAEDLAIALNSGSLPHRVEIVSEQRVASNRAVEKQAMTTGGLVLTFLVQIAGLVWVLRR